MSHESKTVTIGALWHLGLIRLRLHKGLHSLSAHVLIAFKLFDALHLLQAFPVVFLGKVHVPQEAGSASLRDLYLCDWDFLMPFLCHFQDGYDLAVYAWLPGAPKSD